MKSERIADLERAAARLMRSDATNDMPGFTIPSQDRTRLKTSAIIAVAAYLLQSRNFSNITMNEIAEMAGCSVPSIYARFKNKESLLPAIHLLIIEDIRVRLDNELVTDLFIETGFEAFCHTFVGIIFDFFSENHNFVRAAILSEADDVHQQLRHLMPALAERLTKTVVVLMGGDPTEIAPAILNGIDIIVSLLRDASVVHPRETRHDKASLGKLFVLIVRSGFS